MTVRLIIDLWLEITAQVVEAGAVIFLSWNHAVHADNQDCKKSHTVRALQSGH